MQIEEPVVMFGEELRTDTPKGLVCIRLQECPGKTALRSAPGCNEPGEQLAHEILETVVERAHAAGVECTTLTCRRCRRSQDGTVEFVQVIDALELPNRSCALGFLRDAIVRVANPVGAITKAA